MPESLTTLYATWWASSSSGSSSSNSSSSNTRRMAIANGTCVSFCNQPRHIIWLPRESHAGMSLRVQAFGYVKSLRHILASPGYAPGTIAVCVTWIEREFNAGQTYCSIYPSIFNRLRAIARYWSEIATFSYPIAFNAWGCSDWNSGENFGPQKTRIMGLPGSGDSLTIGWAVLTQYQRVMDRRTDRRTSSL